MSPFHKQVQLECATTNCKLRISVELLFRSHSEFLFIHINLSSKLWLVEKCDEWKTILSTDNHWRTLFNFWYKSAITSIICFFQLFISESICLRNYRSSDWFIGFSQLWLVTYDESKDDAKEHDKETHHVNQIPTIIGQPL